MYPDSFLITGLGRSGSKFLANVMSKSRQWNISHEPPSSSDDMYYGVLQRRLSRHKYGEISTYARLCVNKVNCARIGVLLRDPRDCLLSAANRGHPPTREYLDFISRGLHELNTSLEKGAVQIRFSEMTTSYQYLGDVLKMFGITDVDSRCIDITVRVNELDAGNSAKFGVATVDRSILPFKTYDDLPADYKTDIDAMIGDFREKWFPPTSAESISR